MEGKPELINTCLRCSTGCTGDFLCHVNPVKQSKLSTDLAVHKADAPKTGQDWLPKQRRLFEHNVPVLYNEERGNG